MVRLAEELGRDTGFLLNNRKSVRFASSEEDLVALKLERGIRSPMWLRTWVLSRPLGISQAPFRLRGLTRGCLGLGG